MHLRLHLHTLTCGHDTCENPSLSRGKKAALAEESASARPSRGSLSEGPADENAPCRCGNGPGWGPCGCGTGCGSGNGSGSRSGSGSGRGSGSASGRGRQQNKSPLKRHKAGDTLEGEGVSRGVSKVGTKAVIGVRKRGRVVLSCGYKQVGELLGADRSGWQGCPGV